MTFEALGGGLEHIDRVPAAPAAVDSPDGSFSPGTFVPALRFALVSLEVSVPVQPIERARSRC
jgi:hypothetical protein